MRLFILTGGAGEIIVDQIGSFRADRACHFAARCFDFCLESLAVRVMRQGTGDDEGFVCQRAAAFLVAFVEFQHLQQIIDHTTFLRILKKVQKRVGHDFSDSLHPQQLLARQMDDRAPAVLAGARDQARVCCADARDAETVQKSRYCHAARAARGEQKIFK